MNRQRRETDSDTSLDMSCTDGDVAKYDTGDRLVLRH